jgi:hypothetical protein
MKVYSIILTLLCVERGKHMAKFTGGFLKLGTTRSRTPQSVEWDIIQVELLDS